MMGDRENGSESPLSDWPTARYLATDLVEAVHVSSGEPALAAADRLGDGFDQAPVRDLDGKWVGFVLTAELRVQPLAKVEDVTHPLASVIVGSETPIAEVLPLLRAHRFVFVGEPNEPVGFVTPSDLSRQAGRAAFYTRIAAFEIALADLLRRAHNRDDQRGLLRHLSRASRRDVECSFLLARDADTDVDYVAYMDLTDLLVVVGGESRLRREFEIPTQREWQSLTGGLPNLRNDVMHSTREFLSPERSVEKIDDYYQLLGRLTQQAAAAASRHVANAPSTP